MAAHDPTIHRGTVKGTINAILDTLGTPTKGPYPDDVYLLWRRLRRVARELKRDGAGRTMFSRGMFLRIVAAATELAADSKPIPR